MIRMTTSQQTIPDQATHLSERQIQVLALVAEGETTRQIARRLNLSTSTVDNYIQAIRARLDAYSRAHAVALALRQGLLPGKGALGQGT